MNGPLVFSHRQSSAKLLADPTKGRTMHTAERLGGGSVFISREFIGGDRDQPAKHVVECQPGRIFMPVVPDGTRTTPGNKGNQVSREVTYVNMLVVQVKSLELGLCQMVWYNLKQRQEYQGPKH